MELLEIRKSETAPFEIAKINNGEKDVFIILIGTTKVATPFESHEEAEKYIKEKPYELIFCIAEAVYNYKSKENGNNKNNND